MNYNTNWLIKKLNKGDKVKYVFFWGHQPSKTGEITASCFSQWWLSPFEKDGEVFHTAEHWMMAQKALLFNDKENYNKVLHAKSPAEAKAIGRKVKNFNEELWNEKRFEIVVNGNLLKFSQNVELKEFLLNTKDRILVEASPVDNIWGIGLTKDSDIVENPEKWRGMNLLGFALMEVRDLLIN